MQEVTVAMPVERVPEFYQMFGQWLAHNTGVGVDTTHLTPDQANRDIWHPKDGHAATIVWSKLSISAKLIFRRLMESPGEKVSARELAEIAEIDAGRNGVAGALAWPARHCYAVGREFPIRFEESGDTSSYWIFNTPAQLFHEADEDDRAAHS